MFRSNIPPQGLPEGWKAAQLREISTVFGGGRLGLTKADYVSEGVIAYSAAGPDGRVVVTEGIEPSIIVSAIGARCGKSFLTKGPWATLANTQVITPKSDLAEASYLIALLDDEAYWNRSGSAQPFIKPSDIKGAWVPLPPLSEQRRIAEILGSLDAAIEATKAVIEQTKTVKQGLLQTLLMRGIGHTEFKNSPLGEIPKSWEIKPLGKITKRTELGGNYANSTINQNSGYPLIKMGNISRGRINLKKVEYTENKNVVRQEDFLKFGDVLFNTRNTLDLVGKVAIWRSELPVAAYNSNILRLVFDEKIASNFYMNFALNSHRGLAELRKRAVGTTSVAAIYWRDCEGILMPMPPLSEQKEIVALLEAVEIKVDSESAALSSLQTLKKGLMDDLLTGRVRVNQPEKVAA